MGNRITVTVERGSNSYDPTAHPLFLTLNLSEVYGLLISLMKAEKTLYGKSKKYIISDIVSQLTDYAKQILIKSGLDIEAYQSLSDRKFRNESVYDQIFTIMKKGSRCVIHKYQDEHSLTGILKFSHKGGKDVIFVSDDGKELPLDMSEIKQVLEMNTQ